MKHSIANLGFPVTKTMAATFLIPLLLMLHFFSSPVSALTQYAPHIVAPRAVLMDMETGTVLFDKNAFEPTFPASTTKVLTALVVLEQASLDEVVHIVEEPGVGGSSMHIVPGESFTVKTLLQALLIRSANDAAEVLAIHVAGSVEAFVSLMNQRAALLGAMNTHFTNPHGLPNESHVTTAFDLALIAREAMSHPVFREIVASPSLIIPPTSETEQRVYNNSNRFLWGRGPRHQMMYQGQSINIAYEPVDGIKTGFTNSARNCLISSALFNEQRYIAVVLNAEQENIYADSRALLDYGFQHFHSLTVVEKGVFIDSLPVIHGTTDAVPLYTDQSIQAVLPRHVLPEDITREIHLSKEILQAPVEAGTVLGWIEYTLEGEFIGQVKLVTPAAVDFVPLYTRGSFMTYGSASLLLLFCFWQMFVFRLRRKRFKERRRQRIERYRHSETFE